MLVAEVCSLCENHLPVYYLLPFGMAVTLQ